MPVRGFRSPSPAVTSSSSLFLPLVTVCREQERLPFAFMSRLEPEDDPGASVRVAAAAAARPLTPRPPKHDVRSDANVRI